MKKHPVAPDPKNLEVKVKVDWIKGINRLYFLYEAYDDYWDFYVEIFIMTSLK
jgi:hypothetical protein